MERDKFSEIIDLMNRTLNEDNNNIYSLTKENVEEALKELFKKQKSPMEYLRSFKYRNVERQLLRYRTLHHHRICARRIGDVSAFYNFGSDRRNEHVPPAAAARPANLKEYFLPAPVVQYYLVKSMKEHDTAITTIFIERTNRYFLSGDEGGCIKLFNLRTGNLIREFFLHFGGINDINFSHCGTYMISSDSGGCVKINDLLTEKTVVHQFNSSILLVEALEDGMIVLESSGILHKIDKTGRTYINNIIPNCEGAVGAVCISEGANILLVGGSFPFLLLFNLKNFKNEAVILDTEGYTISYVCASRRRTIFMCSSFYNYLFYFEFNVGKGTSNYKKNNNTYFWKKCRIQVDLDEYDYTEKIIFLNDDRYFITTATDNKLRVFKNREMIRTLNNVNGNLLAHPVFNVFLVFNYEIKIYDVWLNVLQHIKLDFFITEISFSDDGYTFIVSDELGNIYMYSLFPTLSKSSLGEYVVKETSIPVNDVEIACLESLEVYSMDISKIKKKYFYEERREDKKSESTASEISEDYTEDLGTDYSSHFEDGSDLSTGSDDKSIKEIRTAGNRARHSAINVITDDNYEIPIRRGRRIISDDSDSLSIVTKKKTKARPRKKTKKVNDDSTDSCCKNRTVKKSKTASEITSEHEGDTTTFSDLSSLSDLS
ncbi:putative WD40 repeat, subgroup, WD40/YVTN repeat-like-containing domain protein [Trachipleistophora hominis]|uniref:Putative WD40 repeat, subgroup, WD40/YVTN repeat-like-containing domain protein n=1 Tax=Trachipleistophora hominis TaxID=72359 RepID=L7JUM9_TRAHO|nr:putative WD40 repeat, subgroup, WD40/YVTN repeat-like-containing domain protein [Trachipleistophora hominis]